MDIEASMGLLVCLLIFLFLGLRLLILECHLCLKYLLYFDVAELKIDYLKKISSIVETISFSSFNIMSTIG